MDLLTLIFLLIAAELAASQVAWWFAKCYFPTRQVCVLVHRHLPMWRGAAHDLVRNIPPGFRPGGVFTSVLWPIAVAMNLVLLAQVLETLIDSDTRLTVPFAGTYGLVAVVMAFLFALTQSALAVFVHQASSKLTRTLLGIPLIATLMVECGLSLYRAILIRGGALPQSGNPTDDLIGSLGIIVTGVFGLLIPLGECLLGAVAYTGFLEPLLVYSVRLTRGLTIYAWCVLTWAMFGWQPVAGPEPELWVETLRSKTKSLLRTGWDSRDQSDTLNETMSTLSSLSRGLQTGRSLCASAGQSSELATRVKTAMDAWPNEFEALVERFLPVRDLHALWRFEREVSGVAARIDLAAEAISRETRQVQIHLKSNRASAKQLERCHELIDGGHRQSTELGQIAAQMNACLEDLERQAADLKAVLNNQQPPHGIVSAAQVAQLQKLIADGNGHPDSWQRDMALAGRKMLEKALEDADQAIREVRPAAAKVSHAIEEFEKLSAFINLPESVNSTDLERLATEIAHTERAAEALLDGQHKDLGRLTGKIAQKEFVLSGKPRWLWIVRHPFGPYSPSAGIVRESEEGGGRRLNGRETTKMLVTLGVIGAVGASPAENQEHEEVSK